MSEEQSQQYSKTETIDILKQTIQRLETIVEKLQEESVKNLPEITPFNNLLITTEELANSLEKKIVSPITEVPKEVIKVSETPISEEKIKPLKVVSKPENDNFLKEEFSEEIEETPPGLDSILPSFNQLQNWWKSVLDSIRSILPDSLNNNLSDLGLTGVISGIIVIILTTSVLLIPEPSPEISDVFPDDIPVNIPTNIPTNIPPELVSPKPPKPVENAPIPQPKFTPEQSLIAAIQGQISNFTNQYTEGLILSIEPNFVASRLLVKVSNEWYNLTEIYQDKVANQMLEQAQLLDFKKLEIVDFKNNLLARSPVIGSQVVILQRNIEN